MKDMLHQVEPLIPALRRYARALTRNRATAPAPTIWCRTA
jgi:DNA-directed RNA polymerase specialized sigma24 family protein